jgi:hypothetical protein
VTPEERAAQADQGCRHCDWICPECVAEAIRSAVADRTEACARIAYGDPERFDWPYYGDVRDIAAAIRALDAADERPDVDAAPPAQDARQDGSFPAGRGGVEKGGE